jgi:hypothetical protein
MSTRYTLEPSPIDYHADVQAQRIQRALKQIDPGDVLAVIDRRIAAESDPKAHPLYGMVCWHLDRLGTPLDGGAFYDRWRQVVLEAIDSCVDDVLAVED